MISQRSKLSLCQYLDLLPKGFSIVLLRKHGMDGGANDDVESSSFGFDTHDSEEISSVIMCASQDQLHSLLSEILRTHSDVRYRVSPRYRHDERWHDLELCLRLDGYIVGDDQLISVDPSIEDAEPLDDDLTATLKASDLPNAKRVIERLNDSTDAFRKAPPDLEVSLSKARIALETTAKDMASIMGQNNSGDYDDLKWGQALKDLRQSNLISRNEEKGLAGVYGFISEGVHKVLGLEDIEMARLGRTLAFGMIYFLVRRFDGSR